jgi:hypothetical protein
MLAKFSAPPADRPLADYAVESQETGGSWCVPAFDTSFSRCQHGDASVTSSDAATDAVTTPIFLSLIL